MRLLCSAAIAFIFASLALPARAWDAEGHELVAREALAQLNPKARAEVEHLAREIVNPEKHYDAVTIACWMDDIRKAPDNVPYYGQFQSWHYIDVPLDARDPMPSFEPGTDTEAHGNAIQALKRALVVLQGGTDPYIPSKAVACAIIMHLVGDIHQPLHCTTKYFLSHGQLRSDKGGNDELVINGPAEPPGAPPFNLHYFWDTAYRAGFDDGSGTAILQPRIDFEKIATLPPSKDNSGPFDFDAWARESHAIAQDFVYPGITVAEDRKHCRLSSVYVDKARTIAQSQLKLAGDRLARLLNATLGADSLPPPPASYPAGAP